MGQELAKRRLTNKVGIVNQANLPGGYGQELIEDLANQLLKDGVLVFCLYVCTISMQCPRKPEEGIRFPQRWEPPYGCWIRPVLLIAKLFIPC